MERDGDRGALSPSARDEALARTRDLFVSVARRRDHTAKPGVGDGHRLHPDARGFVYLAVVLDWAQPSRAVAVHIDHDRGGILHRGA
jgi:hypothetical protein